MKEELIKIARILDDALLEISEFLTEEIEEGFQLVKEAREKVNDLVLNESIREVSEKEELNNHATNETV